MNQVNFDKEMEKIISTIKQNGERPKLLLHACCAPCASACIERIKEFFENLGDYFLKNLHFFTFFYFFS